MRLFIIFTILPCISLFATRYYVDDVSSNGSGTPGNPFNSIQSALYAAQPGDTVVVFPGTFTPGMEVGTVRDGTPSQRITVKAFDPSQPPFITRSGRVFKFEHGYITLDGFILDGQFGNRDVVSIRSGGQYTIIRNCEIKNSVRDGIDLSSANNVLIENCQIHHMLAGTYTNQQDAHGIVATGEKNLTVRGCNIYYVSGDCFQTDPNRGLPLWDNVLIENCQLWTGPLPADAAGWHAGEVPGENAIDTKVNDDSLQTGYRPKITLRNVKAHGFVPGYISNRAAFNIKEQVECTMNAIRVYNNEIAFRLRGDTGQGSAHVTLMNVVAFENDKTFRTEDDVEILHIYNSTFHKASNGVYFRNVSGGYDPAGFDLRNCLFMGTKPGDASDPSNLSADDSFFIAANAHDYHLVQNSPAIDAGNDILQVTEDYDGNPRFPGSYDVGAYEFGNTTGFIFDQRNIPGQIHLFPNYPNPFNPTTRIRIRLQKPLRIRLVIYNLLGQEICRLAEGKFPAGSFEFGWNGKNAAGENVVSGIYFYRLFSENLQQTRKMYLLR